MLLGQSSLRSLLAIVSTFTLAHSVTLALASLGVVAPSAGLVEPLIAASIGLVALDDLRLPRGGAPARLAVTAGFGLIHGFGLAGVLRELTPDDQGLDLAVRLLAFNLGIEAGQVAVLLVAVALLAHLRRGELLAQRGLRAASLAIAALGAYWFLERTPSAG